MDGLHSRFAASRAGTRPDGREGPGVRAGGTALSILAVPLSARILLALAEGSRTSERLREAVGSPPHSALRKNLQALTRHRLLHRRERGDAKGTVSYQLAGPGQDLLKVREAVQAWLDAAPGGGPAPGTDDAAVTIRALVDAWAVNLVRAVASRPFSAAEFAKLISADDAAELQRFLEAMTQLGLLEPAEAAAPTRYVPTPWLRRSVAPLAAGAAWERRHLAAATTPIDRHDVETAFLLSVPLVKLRPERSGRCKLVVELRDSAGESKPVGVLVDLRAGEVVACATRLGGASQSWALGSPQAWLTAVIEGDVSGLKLAGDEDLATDLAWSLHAMLFGR
jgi:DNA-binding HxlR family transcriptional regulator